MLTVKVEGMLGNDVRDIFIEMCMLASRLGCIVAANVNSVHAMVKPGADPRDAYAQWEAEIAGKGPHKVFCAHPVEIPRDMEGDQS
jgi:hypothetical protein